MYNHKTLRALLLFLLSICLVVAMEPNPNPNQDVLEYHKLEKRATHKPGFFKTLFSVIYEQWADTKNTISSVNKQINDNFLPENPPSTPSTTTIPSDSNVTTTAAPFKITRTELNRIVQRNLKGLIRLFNIELEDALKNSDANYDQFKKNATAEVSKFL